MDDGNRLPVALLAPARSPRGGRSWRSLLTLLLTLLTLAGGATVAAADGVPDPAAPGPYDVTKLEYDAGTLLLNLPTAGQTTSVPMKGSLILPSGTGPYKVIVFVHGRHSVCIGTPGTPSAPGPSPGTCLDGTAPDGTPISTDIRSYGGYDYLSRNLASHGYAVMSIEANITGFDNGYADTGADARSQIIQASLKLLDRWNNGRGPVTNDPETTIGTKLVGRLELSSGIGLMGHSRGGDAVTDFVSYNRNLSSGNRWLLSGVLALAPTFYSNRRTPEGTNYATLLPACDGDVSNLQGARFFENAKYAPGNDKVAKIQWYVQGTNHNYFNTVWTGDDFSTASDPACSRTADESARLTPADQRGVGLALMNGFLRRYVGGETAFDPLMTGETTLPAASCPVSSGVDCADEVVTSYVGPSAGRLDVLRPASTDDPAVVGQLPGPLDPNATTTAATGGPINEAGLSTFQVCRPPVAPLRGGVAVPSVYPVCPSAAAQPAVPATPTTPAIPAVTATANRSIGTQLTVDWDGPAKLTAGLGPDGATADVSRFGVLGLRAAVNRADPRNPKGDDVHPSAATQDFDVTLVDADGQRATTAAARWGTALQPSIGTQYRHVVLNGLRIPLTAFAGVDLTRIASVELGFGSRTTTGSIQLADVGFQGVAPPAGPEEPEPPVTPVTPTVPEPDGPPSQQGIVIASPQQQGAVSTPKACVDATRPRSSVAYIRVTRTRLRVAGRASDVGCRTAAGKPVAGRHGGGVARTMVSLSRRSGEGCRFLTRKGKWGPPVYCDNPVQLYAKGTGSWSLALRATLAAGNYTATVTTYDRAGNVTRAARQSVRVR